MRRRALPAWQACKRSAARPRHLQCRLERVPDLDGFDTRQLHGLRTRGEDRTFGPLHPLVSRRQEQRRPLGLPVHDQYRPRHLDAGQVVELIVLSELLGIAGLGRALDDGDAVADLVEELGPTLGEFFLR